MQDQGMRLSPSRRGVHLPHNNGETQCRALSESFVIFRISLLILFPDGLLLLTYGPRSHEGEYDNLKVDIA